MNKSYFNIFWYSCPSSGEMLTKMSDLFPFGNHPALQITGCDKSDGNFLQFSVISMVTTLTNRSFWTWLVVKKKSDGLIHPMRVSDIYVAWNVSGGYSSSVR